MSLQIGVGQKVSFSYAMTQTAENHVTLEKQKWPIFVKKPSIQVRLSLIFLFILVRFTCGL